MCITEVSVWLWSFFKGVSKINYSFGQKLFNTLKGNYCVMRIYIFLTKIEHDIRKQRI